MANKDYVLQFGQGDPRSFTGLSPTFLIFATNAGGTALVAPGISEVITGSGFYNFSYGPTVSISFLADGGSGVSSSDDRYVTGVLDPIQAVDQTIGMTTDSFGSTAIDPTTLFGYLKRNQEFNEGNAEFTKSTGVWSVYSRGSSTLLMTKTLENNTSEATKS